MSKRVLNALCKENTYSKTTIKTHDKKKTMSAVVLFVVVVDFEWVFDNRV